MDSDEVLDFFRIMEIQSSAAAVENMLLAATSLCMAWSSYYGTKGSPSVPRNSSGGIYGGSTCRVCNKIKRRAEKKGTGYACDAFGVMENHAMSHGGGDWQLFE
jgi:hypothetical protein